MAWLFLIMMLVFFPSINSALIIQKPRLIERPSHSVHSWGFKPFSALYNSSSTRQQNRWSNYELGLPRRLGSRYYWYFANCLATLKSKGRNYCCCRGALKFIKKICDGQLFNWLLDKLSDNLRNQHLFKAGWGHGNFSLTQLQCGS